jgi:hypothetical protein
VVTGPGAHNRDLGSHGPHTDHTYLLNLHFSFSSNENARVSSVRAKMTLPYAHKPQPQKELGATWRIVVSGC